MALVTFLVIGAYFLKSQVTSQYRELKKQKVFIAPPKHLKQMSFGFQEILADSLWVRWIQNIGECGKSLQARKTVLKFNASLDNKYSKNQKQWVCDKGWSYQMLDRITDLSPRFRAPYSLGGPTLSVIAEDHRGAKNLFDKGVVNFPEDWSILYRSAYHYIFELNDLVTGSELLRRSANAGAPSWVYSYSAKISSKVGRYDFGISVLEEYLAKAKDPDERALIESKIKKLQMKKKENSN